MLLEVTCMCGFVVRGTDDEVVERIQAHGISDHGAMSSPEQILAMATPIDDGA